MKKTMFLFGAMASFVISADAQTLSGTKVPAPVRSAFTKQYPGVSATWEKEHENFEAAFKKEGVDCSALFGANGGLIESEVEIKISDLSAPMRAYVQQHYNGKHIKAAAKITKADGTLNYEADLKGIDVLFDKNGNFLKEVKD